MKTITKLYQAYLHDSEYIKITEDIISNDTIQKMNQFLHHINVTCLEHSIGVSYYCYCICKYLRWDYISVARAGLMHDLFLYDWILCRKSKSLPLHGFQHPKTALKNAVRHFQLNALEKDIILSHMWPVSFSFPKYKETWIIVAVDKYCCLIEIFRSLKEKSKKSRENNWYVQHID